MKKLTSIFNNQKKDFFYEAQAEWAGLNYKQKQYVIYLKATNQKYDNPNNSSLLYVLDITDICPIAKIKRFGKGGMCDIDCDFAKSDREKVIEYVKHKYGNDLVAHIGTFGKMKAKSAVRNTTRTLGYDYALGDKMARMLLPPIAGKPQDLNTSLEKVSELQEFIETDKQAAEVFTHAQEVEDLLSSYGVHASGVVISNNSLLNKVPLFVSRHGEQTTQWEMNTIEDYGLIKFDFLGLDALTKIQTCLDLIKQRYNKKIDIYSLPDNPALPEVQQTFKLLQAGDTLGLFQLEASSGIRDILVRMRPENLEDLCALVALYRPGPLSSGYADTYLNVKAGIEEPSYLIPELEKILGNTYSIILYQEQCCAGGSPVWTTTGSKPIEKIQIGDLVRTTKGYNKVINTAYTGIKNCLEIITSSGSITCTPDHKIKTLDDNFITANQLQRNSLIRKADDLGSLNVWPWPVSQVSENEIQEAYRIGILLGDGCITKNCTIAAGSKEFANFLLDKFKDWGETKKYFHCRSWYVSAVQRHDRGSSVQKGEFRSEVIKRMHNYNLLGKTAYDKEMPSFVKQNPYLLEACLLGLIDSDGSILPNKPWHITSVSKKLLADIYWAAELLGLQPLQRKNRVYIYNLQLLALSQSLSFKKFPEEKRYNETYVYDRKTVNQIVLDQRRPNESLTVLCRRLQYNIQHLNRKLPWIRISSIPKRILLKLLIQKTPVYSYVKQIKQAQNLPVYDLTIENTHEFNVGGHIVHNCMQIGRELCGYTRGEADGLRKAIGKKLPKLLAEHEPKFKNGWTANGYPRDAVNQLWEDLLNFAAYCFNKSHALAYAYITYVTAYLKANYTLEFICAFLMQESGNQDQIIKCMSECKRIGIPVEPPDINDSQESFSITDDGSIKFGLGPIKNLGTKPVKIIIDERRVGKFKSLQDFCERVDLSVINILKLKSLIKAGAFDKIGPNRASMLKSVEDIWEYNQEVKKYHTKMLTYDKKSAACEQRLVDIAEGKLSDKGKPLKPLKEPVRPECPEFPIIQEIDEDIDAKIQKAEHELLGLYISSHPLDNITIDYDFSTIEQLVEMEPNARIKMAGVITNVQEITTKKTKQKMAFVRIEDLTGSIDAIIFTSTFAKYHDLLEEPRPLKIYGAVDIVESDEERIVKLRITKLEPIIIDLGQRSQTINLTIPVNKVKDLAQILNKYSGTVHTVYIAMRLNDGTRLKANKSFGIRNAKSAFMQEISRLTNEKPA